MQNSLRVIHSLTLDEGLYRIVMIGSILRGQTGARKEGEEGTHYMGTLRVDLKWVNVRKPSYPRYDPPELFSTSQTPPRSNYTYSHSPRHHQTAESALCRISTLNSDQCSVDAYR